MKPVRSIRTTYTHGYRLSIQGEVSDRYITGCVITPHGIVSVYSDDGFTYMEVVNGRSGRTHEWRWQRGFTRRGLVTLARRFAMTENP